VQPDPHWEDLVTPTYAFGDAGMQLIWSFTRFVVDIVDDYSLIAAVHNLSASRGILWRVIKAYIRVTRLS